ncbi:hypothetical protein Tco_0930999 [Tanacetum coccineum]
MVSNQIRPPGFPPIQNNQNRFNPNQGNNFNQNRGTNFNQNRGSNFNQGQVYQPPINQPPVYQAPPQQMQGVSKTDFENYVKANDVVLRNMQNQGQGLQNQMTNLTEMLSKFITSKSIRPSNLETLPKVQNQPDSYQPKLPYPERMKVREKDTPSAQQSRFMKLFKQLRLEIGLKDALIEMPKFNKCSRRRKLKDPEIGLELLKPTTNTLELANVLLRTKWKIFKFIQSLFLEFNDNFTLSEHTENPLFNEMVEDAENENPNVLDFDDPVLLNTPLSDKVECSDLEDNIDEIVAFLDMERSFFDILRVDDLIPPGVENDDSEDEDNELPNLDHQDNPSSPRPPPEPPDVCLNFKPDTAMKNDEDFNQGEIVLSINVEDVNSFPTSLLFIFLLSQFHLLSLRTNEFRDRVKLCDSVTKNKALRGRHPMLIHFLFFFLVSNVCEEACTLPFFVFVVCACDCLQDRPNFSEDSCVQCFVPVHSSFLAFAYH